jgi:hypothetical protein
MKVRMKRFLTKKPVVVMMVTMVMVLSTLMALPATSHASAVGDQYWGGFTVNVVGQSVGIPAGRLTHSINGSGYHINWDAASFGSIAAICDPSIRFTYGNGSYYLDGNVQWGCSIGGGWKYGLNWNAPRGSACAELWAKNWQILVARQCHYVYG